MKPGRKKLDFNWNLVDSLMMLEASEEFVAERMLIDEKRTITHRTIQAKVKLIQRRINEVWGVNFVQYRKQKIEFKKISLRQKQWKAVDDCVPSLLIWMGKQYLGQADKHEERVIQEKPSEVKIIWQAMPGAPTVYDTKGRPEVEEEADTASAPLDSLD